MKLPKRKVSKIFFLEVSRAFALKRKLFHFLGQNELPPTIGPILSFFEKRSIGPFRLRDHTAILIPRTTKYNVISEASL